MDSVADLDVEGYGKTIEHMTSIFPNKTNVTFVEFVRKDYIKIREWERNRRDDRMRDRLCDGGCGRRPHRTDRPESDGRADRRTAFIEWDEKTNRLFMSGPSHTVFESEIDASHIIG